MKEENVFKRIYELKMRIMKKHTIAEELDDDGTLRITLGDGGMYTLPLPLKIEPGAKLIENLFTMIATRLKV